MSSLESEPSKPHEKHDLGCNHGRQAIVRTHSNNSESAQPAAFFRSVSMNLTIIGAGFVGLVTALCLAHLGHHLTCVDIDQGRLAILKAGQVPLFEPCLTDKMESGISAGHLGFTDNFEEGCGDAEAVLIAVGAPSRPHDGHSELRHIRVAAPAMARAARTGTIIVITSTFPVSTGDEIETIITGAFREKRFTIASRPEFLRERAATTDFAQPERIVIGASDAVAISALQTLFQPTARNDCKIIVTSRRSTVLIKYTANVFLATKIAFINEIADLCEAVGVDIGRKFLNAGPGFGGSCYPKDASALLRTVHDGDTALRIVETLMTVNDQRRRTMARNVVWAAGRNVGHRTIAVLGLTFEPHTDD